MADPQRIKAATVEVELEDGTTVRFRIPEIRDGAFTYDQGLQVERMISDPAMVGMSGIREVRDYVTGADPELHLDITDMRGQTIEFYPGGAV